MSELTPHLGSLAILSAGVGAAWVKEVANAGSRFGLAV